MSDFRFPANKPSSWFRRASGRTQFMLEKCANYCLDSKKEVKQIVIAFFATEADSVRGYTRTRRMLEQANVPHVTQRSHRAILFPNDAILRFRDPTNVVEIRSCKCHLIFDHAAPRMRELLP